MKRSHSAQEEVWLEEPDSKPKDQKNRDRKTRRQDSGGKKNKRNADLNISGRTGPDSGSYSIRFNLEESRKLTEDQKNTILRTLLGAPAEHHERAPERPENPRKIQSRTAPPESSNREAQGEVQQPREQEGKKPLLDVLADNPGIVPIYISGVFSGIALTLFFGMNML